MISFTIWLTNKCNLKCAYCYEKNNIARDEPNVSHIDEIVGFITEKVAQYGNEDVSISFHGGEPLLKYEDIKIYIKLIKASIKKRRIFFSMTTNGTLLNRKKATYLKHNIKNISISIDGTQYAHDLNRTYQNGLESYKDVMYNLERAKFNKEKLRVRMTVSANNVRYLAEGVEDLVDRGFRCIVPAVAVEDSGWNEEKFNILENELKTIKKKFHSRDDIKIAMIDKLEMRRKSECGGGIKSFNILCNGDVYPCEFVAGNKKYLLGNIKNLQVDEDKLKTIYELGGCNDCEGCTYQIYCKGTRCKYMNVINTGQYHIPPESLCEVENIKFRVYNFDIYNQ